MKTICRKCKISKDNSMFYGHTGRKNNIQTICKECDNQYKRIWRAVNPKQAKAQNRKHGRIHYFKKTPLARAITKQRLRISRREMHDYYIRNLIILDSILTKEDITQEMIDAYRLNLSLKRELKLTPPLKK